MEKMVESDLGFYKNKKILITGHTGFKGTWLSRMLLSAGAMVVGYSLDPPTVPSLFFLTDTKNKIKSIHGDVRNLSLLTKVFKDNKPEIVFHLAAQPIVRLSYEKPVETFETNILGTVNVLEATRLCSSVHSLVNITTDKVYENKEWLWGYRENEKLCGYDPYSNSKSCSELVTSSYRNSFFNKVETISISSARSGNVIGGGDFARDRIIPDCVRAVLNNNTLVVRNKHSIRPYQHVLDCLTGYLLLAEKQYGNKSLEGAYNFGPNEDGCVTTGTLVDMFFNYWGGGSWEAQESQGPHEANYLRLDCSRARQKLGWSQNWDIHDSIKSVVDWTRGYNEGLNISELIDSQIKTFLDKLSEKSV